MGGRNIDFICDRKLRLMTLKRRKMGLIKKAKELSTLCGVDLVVLLYSSSSSPSDSDASSSIDYAFPQDPLQARAIVDRYRSEFKKPKQNHRPRLRVQEIPSKKKPSPSQSCSSSLQMKLKAKIEAVRERIKFLKNTPSPWIPLPPLTEFEPVEEEQLGASPEHVDDDDDAGYHHQMEMLIQDNDGDDHSSAMISDLLLMLEDEKESRCCFSQCPPRLLPHVSQPPPQLLPLCRCVPKMNLDYTDDYCDCRCYMPLSPTTSSYQYPYQPMQQKELSVNSPSVYFESYNSLTNLGPPRTHNDDDLMMMGMQREGSFMTTTMMTMMDAESQLQPPVSQLPSQLLPLCRQYASSSTWEEYCPASPFDGLGLDYCFGV